MICIDYEYKMKELKRQIKSLDQEVDMHLREANELNSLLVDERMRRSELQRMTGLGLGESEPPKWLDVKKPYYFPQIDIPKLKSGKVVTKRTMYEPADLYAVTPSIYKIAKRLLAKNGDVLNYAAIYSTWGYVAKKWKYAYDKGEFWEPAFISIYEKEVDCESSTTIFMTLLRAMGFKSKRIFNATGWVYTNNGPAFGHSYPVVYLDEMVGWKGPRGWYVFESTLDNVPKYPQKWDSIGYGADWGLHNWRWGGQIKPEFYAPGTPIKKKIVQIPRM